MLRAPEEQAAKYARVSQAGGKSSNRHIETEQRRRDRINEGCVAVLRFSMKCPYQAGLLRAMLHVRVGFAMMSLLLVLCPQLQRQWRNLLVIPPESMGR